MFSHFLVRIIRPCLWIFLWPSDSQGECFWKCQNTAQRRRNDLSDEVRALWLSFCSNFWPSVNADSGFRTLILAGHETTANSLSWTLLELARHPEMQSRLRTEIREVEQSVHARGDSAFTVADFENMHYMSAVVKVSHCSVPFDVYFIQGATRRLFDSILSLTITSGRLLEMTFCHFLNLLSRHLVKL